MLLVRRQGQKVRGRNNLSKGEMGQYGRPGAIALSVRPLCNSSHPSAGRYEARESVGSVYRETFFDNNQLDAEWQTVMQNPGTS